MFELLLSVTLLGQCPQCNIQSRYVQPGYSARYVQPEYQVITQEPNITWKESENNYSRFSLNAMTPKQNLIRIEIINNVMPSIISEEVKDGQLNVVLDYEHGWMYKYDSSVKKRLIYKKYGPNGSVNFNQVSPVDPIQVDLNVKKYTSDVKVFEKKEDLLPPPPTEANFEKKSILSRD